MIDKIDDIGLIFQICGAGDPHRLIEYNIGKLRSGAGHVVS
jgi:hypothetical protein